ncbi:glutamate--cysteine ligase [cf. Phormidesmis sp. LEGE 11477]|uniref:glutamate--cysteine ligase n=1 Tax=cf. Phormidesmis sp. LEGE 11477 TaxID=1828680 RepID=UPI0018828E29|nr:glutamate--cysteine ligase [cf. Phormidesmis sp. LEGE 11477]MBE9064771.1 glutamate--cysteine ligase [cf. Phormidesmis sp. LEGE 11477]
MSFNIRAFKFGIEHEVAFIRPDGKFADFANTTFAEFETIVARLPHYDQDYPQLRVGDAGIKLKRWYVEGFERFDQKGEVIDCPPKGIEIRTTVHDSIDDTLSELRESFERLRIAAKKSAFLPALTSFHPYRAEFIPTPPLNHYEQQRRQESPEMRTAHIPMLTQGPDLNLSAAGLTPTQLVDIGRKLTYYSPFIIPFSYSSPFYQGSLWPGLSARTFYRTGARPAAMVFVAQTTDLIDSMPSLTQLARIPAEVGRIEFKAFDSCGDFELYGSLLTLLKGLVLDQSLPGRATTPDAKWHQHSARFGFADKTVYDQAQAILAAVNQVELDAEERDRLTKLQEKLNQRYSPAHKMIETYKRGESIVDILQQGYEQQPSSENYALMTRRL